MGMLWGERNRGFDFFGGYVLVEIKGRGLKDERGELSWGIMVDSLGG